MLFDKAKPIWIKGAQEEKHINLGLCTAMDKRENVFVRVAVSGFYKIYVNGEFVYYGPIRAAHNYYRVDEVPIGKYLKNSENFVAIETVNYCMHSFYSLKQSGFIQAEIVSNNEVLAYTDERNDDFDYYSLNYRIRKMQVYSFQRTITEGYRLNSESYNWTIGKPSDDVIPAEIQWTGKKNLLEREIKLHTFPFVSPNTLVSKGNVTIGNDKPCDPFLLYNYRDGVTRVRGFTPDELEFRLSDEISKFEFSNIKAENSKYSGELSLKSGEYKLLALPNESTGFITLDIKCQEKTTIYFTFDEILDENGLVDPFRLICVNSLYLELQKGEYHFMAMEPVGFKYLNVICTKGNAEINNLGLTEYVNPYDCIVKLNSDISAENKVFDAAWQTFRQNAADLFFDCPTRERAGWLCDSFFIGRAAQFFTGDTVMEKQFLENYVLHSSDEHLPFGMLPQSYPSDTYSGNYIVNWAMWYVVELYDYIKRSKDFSFAKKAKELVYNLLSFLETIENDDGLLDRLPAWAFVEWSKANDFVQDINFPNNMVYSYILRVVGKLYDDEAAAKKGEKLKELILKRSYNGEFFVDNEVYQNGVPVSSGETSETCQYHAFFFDIATPQSHPELWEKLTTDFGPEREEKDLYPNVYPANAFTGNFLRLDILLRYGLYDRCREEIVGYFNDMAEKTGTLWEYVDTTASCNHGFASYAGFLLYNVKNKTTPDFMII